MNRSKRFVGGVALLSAGATAALIASHVHVSFNSTADAAPPLMAEVKAALPPPSAAQVADARALGRTFSQVSSQLSPSVVRIAITKGGKTQRGRRPQGGNPFRGTPFERFFGGGGDDDDEGFSAPAPKQRGMGSGVVIDPKGYILTNNHVVEDADEVKVTFDSGKEVTGRVVGTDPKSDLAVVKVDNGPLKAAKLGDSDKLQVGEWVIAIGNPFGLDHTVTVGVLSAKNRFGFQSGHFEDFLQTDASINPGNSGGPLVNLEGEVIGINTMIAGIGTGIGFAVPSSMAKPVVEQLIHNGKVRRPYLGILMQDLTPELQKSLGQKAPEKGALVGQVQSGSPAEKAGVKAGDVIERVDGQPVDGSKAVQRTVLTKKIGQKVDLAIWRDGKESHVAATTAELPSEGASEGGGPQHGGSQGPKAKLGLGLQSLTPGLAERLGIEKGQKGAIVVEVRPDSPAQEAGVRERDVILEIDRKAVGSSDEASRLLSNDKPGGHLLRIRRGDSALFIVLPSSS
jgi:serine protease Do